MSVQPRICVLLCIGDYMLQAGVTVFSLVDHNPAANFDIYVASFCHDKALADVAFAAARGRQNCNIKYVDLDNSLFSDLPITQHINKSTYARLIINRLIDVNYQRVLYIDADTLVCGDIRQLWQTSLDGYILAAVHDYFNPCLDAIGFAPSEFYLNAGVPLIDMARWREEDCEARLLAYLQGRSSTPWMDQDALNVVLRGRVKPIGLEWNYQPRCADVPARFIGLDQTSYSRLVSHPTIIHFTTSLKPWNAAHKVHYSDLYFSVVSRAGLDAYLKRPRLQSWSDVVAKIKTKLRWHFPLVFRAFRRLLKPEAAAAMYRAGPDEKKLPAT